MPKKNLFAAVALGAFTLAQFMLFVPSAQAAALTGGSLSLSDSRPGETATYTFAFTGTPTATTAKCVEVVFATTASGSTVPTAMDTTAATIDSSTMGVGSWTLDNVTNGTLTLTDATGASLSSGNVVFGGIDNGTTDDTGYYARFNTYSDEACTTGIDNSTVMFIYTTGQVVSVTVDPTLSFTIAGVAASASVNGATTTVATTTDANTIPLGTVSPSANAIAAHDLTVGTNAVGGYSVYTRYTGQLTYDTSSIADHTGSHGSPTSFPAAGTAAFGYTTEDTNVPQFTSNTWAAFTGTNAVVATNTAAASETTRVGYQVGVASTTPAGNYTTTIIYTATPTY